jgi:hypothetical protein
MYELWVQVAAVSVLWNVKYQVHKGNYIYTLCYNTHTVQWKGAESRMTVTETGTSTRLINWL